jgi:hypothetical protein
MGSWVRARQIHDLNNAMAIVINYAALVRSQIDRAGIVPDERRREALAEDVGEIETAAARATELLATLLGGDPPGP